MVCRYTGKEPSPKGFGICAHEMYESAVSIGTDGRKWVVRADKNGRLSWKPKTTRRVATNRQGVARRSVVKRQPMRIKRATNMEEAKRNLKFLRSIGYEDESFETANMPPVMFVPQRGIRARYAKKGAKGNKGWLIGQFGVSNALDIIYESSDTAPIKKFAKNDEEARGWFYVAGGHLVTGSGADPVFEIL